MRVMKYLRGHIPSVVVIVLLMIKIITEMF